MNFKFYQLYRSLKEVVGEDKANEIFPEYETLKDKMTKEEQVNFARTLMQRLDEQFDKDTVIAIRMKHPCGIPKESKKEISCTEEQIGKFINHLGGSYKYVSDNEYIITWGLTKCVCGMFYKLENYEAISPTWCQCCNGHNKMLFSTLLDKDIKSTLLEGICAGGKTCSFRIEF